MGFQSVNPSTGSIIAEMDYFSTTMVNERLDRAKLAFIGWRYQPVSARTKLLRSLHDALLSEIEILASLITAEMGKPLKASRDEVEKCAACCNYYADNAADFLRPEQLVSTNGMSQVVFQPLGPILAVMPWNYPMWQFFRFAVPAIAAGNVALLKPAEGVGKCGLAIENAFRTAGFPESICQTVLSDTASVAAMIDHPVIAGVTLTGSVRAGREVGRLAGQSLKKAVLELGGSDPFIVTSSADVVAAARAAALSRTVNAGQSCISAKRFLVDRTVYEQFCDAFCRELKQLKVGNPLDSETDMGPMASQASLNAVVDQVHKLRDCGANEILTGGQRDEGSLYFEPAVFSDIPTKSAIWREEIFGPVAMVVPVDGTENAIEAANDTSFGLGSSVWTSSVVDRNMLIERLDCGMVFVNEMVASHPSRPFGGVKNSGVGRELGRQGILEFTNSKTVVIS